mmetsp:Transcript_7160/g.12809  ORF Transcript_7160/g.12809 Transcript_7160/m.12809 type:complete len:427 (-) Transcript_7160:271-1551(-)
MASEAAAMSAGAENMEAEKAGPQVIDNAIVVGVKIQEHAVSDKVVVGMILQDDVMVQEKEAAHATEPKNCRCHAKKIIALAIGTIVLLGVGISVGFVLLAERGDQARARTGFAPRPRVEPHSGHVIHGHLLLSVQDADSFLVDSKSAKALSLAIAEVSPGVEADMVRINEISKVEPQLRGNGRRLAETPVEVDYSLLLGKDVDAQALEAKVQDVRPESLESALAETMQKMGMESTVEVTMMQVEGERYQADEPSIQGTPDGHLHGPEGNELDKHGKPAGNRTEAGYDEGKDGHDSKDKPLEHDKPWDYNHTMHAGKDGHDGKDKQSEHGKPCDDNQTMHEGKDGHDGKGKLLEHDKPCDDNQTTHEGKDDHDGKDKPFKHGKPCDGNHTEHRNSGKDGLQAMEPNGSHRGPQHGSNHGSHRSPGGQ